MAAEAAGAVEEVALKIKSSRMSSPSRWQDDSETNRIDKWKRIELSKVYTCGHVAALSPLVSLKVKDDPGRRLVDVRTGRRFGGIGYCCCCC